MNEDFLGGFILAGAAAYIIAHFAFGNANLSIVAAIVAGLVFGLFCLLSSRKGNREDL